MAEYFWKSILADKMQEYINFKRIIGFKFEVERRWLERFDDYCFANGYDAEQSICKKVIDKFIYGIDYEKNSTHYCKEKVLSGFAVFLCNKGLNAYICIRKSIPKSKPSSPYIYSKKELADFFRAIDFYPNHPLSNRHQIDPLMFRMIYGCGLRLSEVLKLKVNDVDLVEGTLFIRKSKNDKDRQIPVAESLRKQSIDYVKNVHLYHTDDAIFFPSSLGRRCDKSTVYRRFRDYLWAAGIPHSGHGPRIHDFRHTYCVHCMKNWVLSGKDLMNLLPYLSVYMGHSDFRGTEYYLRLTADLYPEIISRTEAVLGYLIPKGDLYEEN